MRHSFLFAMLLLTGCGASFTWQLPVESAYYEAEQAMALFCENCKPRLLVSNSVDGAALLPTADGSYVIIYNRDQLLRIQSLYGRDALLFVFFHELGHMRDMIDGLKSTEESADLQAGCGLAIIGADTYPARELLAAEAKTTTAHPPVKVRIASIADGYSECLRLWRVSGLPPKHRPDSGLPSKNRVDAGAP